MKKEDCDVPDQLKSISNSCVKEFSSSREASEDFGNSLQYIIYLFYVNSFRYTFTSHSGTSFLLDGSWYPQKGGFTMQMDADSMSNITQMISQLEVSLNFLLNNISG